MEKLEKALSTRIMKFATRGVKLILGKAKYEKRTGGPGHYKYKYFRERKKTRAKVEAMEEKKKKKPISSKKYMKEHAGDIRREADELKRMGQEDFKRKKEEHDKKKKGRRASDKRTIKEKQKLPESKEKFVGRMKRFTEGFDE